MTTCIEPRPRMSRVKPREYPWPTSGPLSQYLARFPIEKRFQESLRWHRGQMRSWALHWRGRRATAALLGKDAEEIGKTNLYFATMYREEWRKLKGGAA